MKVTLDGEVWYAVWSFALVAAVARARHTGRKQTVKLERHRPYPVWVVRQAES